MYGSATENCHIPWDLPCFDALYEKNRAINECALRIHVSSKDNLTGVHATRKVVFVLAI
jgi:hypothetical protein